MSLEAIAAIDAIPADAALTAAQSPDTAGAAFDSLMSHLQELNSRMAAGQGAVSQLALGQADNLHQVQSAGTRVFDHPMIGDFICPECRGRLCAAYQQTAPDLFVHSCQVRINVGHITRS